jgi:hypothetical protein
MPGTRLLHVFILALSVLYAGCGENRECRDEGDCDLSNGEYCSPSGTCKCLWWENRTITFYMNENCSSDVTLVGCLSGVQAAIDYWNAPECSDVLLVFGGTTTRRDVGYDPHREDNINLIIWLESSWQTQDCPEPGKSCRDPRVESIATTTYNNANGQALDTDIEFNGESIVYTETDVAFRLIYHFSESLGVRDLDSLCARFPTGEPCPCADEVVR